MKPNYSNLCGTYSTPIFKMNRDELLSKIKLYRNNWEKLTKRSMDQDDEYLETLSVKDLRNIIKWYYSEDCRKNSREYLNKKSNSFTNKFLGLFKIKKQTVKSIKYKRSNHKRSNNKRSNNKRSYNNKKSKKINKPRKDLNSKCEIQTTKKYQTRKGPPLKANDCKGLTAKGNDDMIYESVPDKRGIYRWVKI